MAIRFDTPIGYSYNAGAWGVTQMGRREDGRGALT